MRSNQSAKINQITHLLGRCWLRLMLCIGERDLALKQATRSMIALPSTKDPMVGPALEAYVAFIQAIFGETNRPISTLARLLQTPGFFINGVPLTPALLRLDPIWDPLRSRSRFPKTLRRKAAAGHAVAPLAECG